MSKRLSGRANALLLGSVNRPSSINSRSSKRRNRSRDYSTRVEGYPDSEDQYGSDVDNFDDDNSDDGTSSPRDNIAGRICAASELPFFQQRYAIVSGPTPQLSSKWIRKNTYQPSNILPAREHEQRENGIEQDVVTAAPVWQWDESRQDYCWYDEHTECWIYGSGQRLPRDKTYVPQSAGSSQEAQDRGRDKSAPTGSSTFSHVQNTGEQFEIAQKRWYYVDDKTNLGTEDSGKTHGVIDMSNSTNSAAPGQLMVPPGRDQNFAHDSDCDFSSQNLNKITNVTSLHYGNSLAKRNAMDSGRQIPSNNEHTSTALRKSSTILNAFSNSRTKKSKRIKAEIPIFITSNVQDLDMTESLSAEHSTELASESTVDTGCIIKKATKTHGPMAADMLEPEIIENLDYLSAITTVSGDELLDFSLSKDVLSYPSSARFDAEYITLQDLSSYASPYASVLSSTSLAFPPTDLSKESGFSQPQIMAATIQLVSILVDDPRLFFLYEAAFHDEHIGPERLRRKLRRMIKTFAENLMDEHKGRLEYSASRLVRLKSRYLTECIMDKLCSISKKPASSRISGPAESSDDDDDQEKALNEDTFGDLVVFREFLVGSVAFATLRNHIQGFVKPNVKNIAVPREETQADGQGNHLGMERKSPDSNLITTWSWVFSRAGETLDHLFRGENHNFIMRLVFFLYLDVLFLLTDRLFITMGFLEPILLQDMTRLRWKSVHGHESYSDVVELREGGVDELVTNMSNTSACKIEVTTWNNSSTSQRYILPRPGHWLRAAVPKVSSFFHGSSRSAPGLPCHHATGPTTATSMPLNPPTQVKLLHLLSCIHKDRRRKILKQDRVEDIATDRALLCFLRQRYNHHKGRFLHKLSFKSVKGIYFVKLRVPIGGSVIVQNHDPHCASRICECLPPADKVEPSPTAEYRCIHGPPATYPPIPPEWLADRFATYTDDDCDDTWILDQLPRRVCGALAGAKGQPAEGWGIYFKEGPDRSVIALLVLALSLFASILFAVLYMRFKYDLQGAFAVSTFIMAPCAAIIPVIVTQADG